MSYHHKDLRPVLISTGRRLIEERGQSELTMRSLALGANVSHTAVYRHFSDKNTLLCEIASEGFLDLAQSISKQVKKTQSPADNLKLAGIAYVNFVRKNRNLSKLMFDFERNKNVESSSLEESSSKAFNQLFNIIKEGTESRDFKASPETLSIAAWSLVHGFSLISVKMESESKEYIDHMLESVINTFIEGARLK